MKGFVKEQTDMAAAKKRKNKKEANEEETPVKKQAVEAN